MLGESVQLLGFAEALHGSEEILVARNRLFQRLVTALGHSAIVFEVTSPQARAMNEYALGLRSADDPGVQEWFGTGFGVLDANRELIEWMRRYNADAATTVKLHFYGFDLPLRAGGLASPAGFSTSSSRTLSRSTPSSRAGSVTESRHWWARQPIGSGRPPSTIRRNQSGFHPLPLRCASRRRI